VETEERSFSQGNYANFVGVQAAVRRCVCVQHNTPQAHAHKASQPPFVLCSHSRAAFV